MDESYFDFGFTAVDYDPNQAKELESTAKKSQAMKVAYETAYGMLRRDIETLLTNMEANPDKEYIYWPNRAEKIAEFRDRIDSYAPGE